VHPAKDEEYVKSPPPALTGIGAKILDKYSMSKTAEQQGVEAVVRGNLKH